MACARRSRIPPHADRHRPPHHAGSYEQVANLFRQTSGAAGSPATGRWPNDSSNTQRTRIPTFDPRQQTPPSGGPAGGFRTKNVSPACSPVSPPPPPQRHHHSEILWRDCPGCWLLLSIKQHPLLPRLSKGRVGAVAVSDPSQRMRIRGQPQPQRRPESQATRHNPRLKRASATHVESAQPCCLTLTRSFYFRMT